MELSQKMLAFLLPQQHEFCDVYPTASTAALVERFGVSAGTIYRWARHLGLKKDPVYRAEIQRQNAVERTLSKEARAKIATARRGRSWTDEQRAKFLQTRLERGIGRGERHYNWKGGRP